MQEEEILQSVSAALTEKPIEFKIGIVNPTLKEKIFIKLKRIEPYRVFYVKPLVFGKLIQISEELLKIDRSMFEAGKNIQFGLYKVLREFNTNYGNIVAIALSKGITPSNNIKRFLIANTTPREIYELSLIILKQMDLQSFYNTITITLPLQIVSPQTKPAEIIASGDL